MGHILFHAWQVGHHFDFDQLFVKKLLECISSSSPKFTIEIIGYNLIISRFLQEVEFTRAFKIEANVAAMQHSFSTKLRIHLLFVGTMKRISVPPTPHLLLTLSNFTHSGVFYNNNNNIFNCSSHNKYLASLIT